MHPLTEADKQRLDFWNSIPARVCSRHARDTSPLPPVSESVPSPPLTKADLHFIRNELKSCICGVEACQRQVHDVDRKLEKLAEMFNSSANALCLITLIFYGGSRIFSHIKVGWA